MTWRLAISCKKQVASHISIKMVVSKSDRARLVITIPNTIAARLKMEDADYCCLYWGEDEFAGQMMITKAEGTEDGAVKVGKLAHCLRLTIDPLPNTRVFRGLAARCELSTTTSERVGCIIKLPEWARPQSTPATVETSNDKHEPFASLEISGNRLICGTLDIKFTKSQVVVLELLIKNFGKCVRRQQLLDDLYSLDPNGGADDKIIEVYIAKIRSKLKEEGVPLHIITHHGIGYELRRAQT